MVQQPHVLIIEDDPWQADIHTRRLQAAGYSVAVAHSPVQAMQAALQHTPQVIVADVLLSGNTILLLLNELQSDRALGAIPVVLCTNQYSKQPDHCGLHYCHRRYHFFPGGLRRGAGAQQNRHSPW